MRKRMGKERERQGGLDGHGGRNRKKNEEMKEGNDGRLSQCE